MFTITVLRTKNNSPCNMPSNHRRWVEL